jgi:hypothetical protein
MSKVWFAEGKGRIAVEFWKKNSTALPLMAAEARLLFAIPATSAFCERFFSKISGFIMRPHRNSISNELAESLFFLRGNSDVNFKIQKKNKIEVDTI